MPLNTVPISDFDDAIFFELQKKLNIGQRPSFTFNEIIKFCSEAGPNFMAPSSPEMNRKSFFARLIDAIKMNERIGLLAITDSGAGKIGEIRLTDEGKEYVGRIVFSNQSRMSRTPLS